MLFQTKSFGEPGTQLNVSIIGGRWSEHMVKLLLDNKLSGPPFSIPILTEVSGTIVYTEIIESVTMQEQPCS